ncbi:MAG TPA: hypothetical protein VIK51_03650 [Vicinamibacteria bacterium]
MDEQPTCGRGLAERSVLPEKLSRLTAALAEVLDIHTKALDPTDNYSKIEHAAYSRLVEEHRRIAAELAATAKRMAGYWNLPMGKHDQQAMSNPRAFEAFETFVEIEGELVAALQDSLRQDRKMLSQMGATHEA